MTKPTLTQLQSLPTAAPVSVGLDYPFLVGIVHCRMVGGTLNYCQEHHPIVLKMKMSADDVAK